MTDPGLHSLRAVVERSPTWAGHVPRKLPWADPEFSRRMLAEHLDQSHDMASRRVGTIDHHVEWIFASVLGSRPGRVLDLGCGPGLYTERLAALGCTCVGIDYSPASIEHAGHTARTRGLDIAYRCEDLVTADLGSHHDLAMMLFGEFNTFPRDEAAALLARIQGSLAPGGSVLLEAHTRDAVVALGGSPASWHTAEGGLFSESAHVVLEEQVWDEESAVARFRIFVVDAASAAVQVYGHELVAYSDDEYHDILTDAGFVGIRFRPRLGEADDPLMVVITAQLP